MADLALVHLVRKANGPEPFRRFLESYRAVDAGAPHDLVLLLKGFASQQEADTLAEGVEALKELNPPLDTVLHQLSGGVQSGMGYLGARTLPELRTKARYIRVTPAGQRESAPHDIVEVKAGN